MHIFLTEVTSVWLLLGNNVIFAAFNIISSSLYCFMEFRFDRWVYLFRFFQLFFFGVRYPSYCRFSSKFTLMSFKSLCTFPGEEQENVSLDSRLVQSAEPVSPLIFPELSYSYTQQRYPRYGKKIFPTFLRYCDNRCKKFSLDVATWCYGMKIPKFCWTFKDETFISAKWVFRINMYHSRLGWLSSAPGGGEWPGGEPYWNAGCLRI